MLLDAEGKPLKGHREDRAMKNKTRFGKMLDLVTWIEHEYHVQQALFAAGADVPTPIAHGGNTILMDYLGVDALAAPTLNEVTLEPAEAQALFRRTMDNVRLMLSRHLVHGDLSAYNILYWEGRLAIIDFPQVVDCRRNRSAHDLLRRDVQRVYDYFSAYEGIEDTALETADDLWQQYMDALL